MTLIAPAAFALAACTVLFAQAPEPVPADTSAPGFDISGYWTAPLYEDALERGAGPEIADYGGFPINEAARLFALSYDASRVTLRHHQCDGYVAPYSVRSIGNARSWEERDPHTQRLIAIHWYNQTFEGHRTIWMDGRPHPPAWAPHTWMGFSTGRFVGQALEVQTTHLKQGWLRRNGLPESDQATLVEFFVRHGDHLTYTSLISDPVYLTEPEIRTTDFARQPIDHGRGCSRATTGSRFSAERRSRAQLRLRREPVRKREGDRTKFPRRLSWRTGNHVSRVAREAGVADRRGGIGEDETASGRARQPRGRSAAPRRRDSRLAAWRNNVYLLLGDGGNIVVQVGDEGAFVVDTGTGALADKTVAAIRKLSDKPIQFIVNTGYSADHTGGNAALRAAGADPSVVGSFFALGFADAGIGATIMAHQNVQNHMYD